MSCFEDAVRELTGYECPPLEGEDWALQLQAFLAPLGYRARFVPIDRQVIVSRRLTNGKVHAEVMYPTLVTILEKT